MSRLYFTLAFVSIAVPVFASGSNPPSDRGKWQCHATVPAHGSHTPPFSGKPMPSQEEALESMYDACEERTFRTSCRLEYCDHIGVDTKTAE